MNVPFIDLSRLTKEFRDDVLRGWAECYDKSEFVGGPRVATLEGKLSKELGVAHTIACANGTDALIIGLQAIGVRAGMKVALPNLTFWATYEAIALLGATPVLVDIDPTDLQMSFPAFVKAHEEHKFTHGILVHLYGWASAQLAEFRAYCTKHNIGLLEDGAQCFGVQVAGKPVLAGALLGTTSFYPAKVIGGAMDGGAIFASTKEQETMIRSLCNHGRSTHYSYAHVGWNSRMGGVQATFLNAVVDRATAIVDNRRKAAEHYRARLSGSSKVKVYGPPAGVSENGYLNVITVPGRKGQDIVDALKAKGIGSARTYPETMDQQPPAKGQAILAGDLSHSRAMCDSVVNLPLFYGITTEECDHAVNTLMEILG